VRPATPPRFVRDTMEINDIEGVRPKKNKQVEYKTRETMNIDDIEGAKAHIRHSPRRQVPGYDAYDYNDITKAQFISTRTTNPLNPVYQGRDSDGKLVNIGEVEGSKPKPIPNVKKDPNIQPSSSLFTQDINGAQAGSKYRLGAFGGEGLQRSTFGRTNNLEDIDGAFSGSLKKSPPTKRNVNPLNPNYQIPGNSELSDFSNPFSGKKGS